MVQTIAIASGKGGVGKTSIAVNTALKLALDKKRVALLDADFGLANAHIMLDQRVEANVSDFLNGLKGLDDIIYNCFAGLKLIPGGSGILDVMNIDSQKRWEVVRSVDHLKDDLDYLFVDTPAGASDSSIEFAAACDNTVVILVGEPTSFMDAYAFIKALNIEKGINKVSVIVNLAQSKAVAKDSFERFQKICIKFLDIELNFLGWLPDSKVISNSIISRKPYILNKNLDGNLITRVDQIVNNLVELKPFKSSNVRFFSS